MYLVFYFITEYTRSPWRHWSKSCLTYSHTCTTNLTGTCWLTLPAGWRSYTKQYW